MKNTNPTIEKSIYNKEYHDSKNPLKSNQITMGSNKLLWWTCPLCHEYQKTPKNMKRNSTNCPYCKGDKLLEGFNDLLAKNPKLAKEYSSKNFKKPHEYYYKSTQKVLWVCELNHEWEATINSRQDKVNSKTGKPIKGTNCPYCGGQKILKGFNDLKTLFPNIAKEYSNNLNSIPLNKLTFGSNRQVWWQCENQHSYKATPSARTHRKRGCPYCSNQKIMEGLNDLKSYCSKNNLIRLLKEWDYEKNNIKPHEIYYGSNSKIWWKCKNNHEWETSLKLRTINEYSCPKCYTPNSKEEIATIEYLLPKATSATLNLTFNSKKLLQIDGLYRNIVIEYDGSYWHNNINSINNDEVKTRILLENNYKIIRIRKDLPPLNINHNNYLEVSIKDLKDETLHSIKNILNQWMLTNSYS